MYCTIDPHTFSLRLSSKSYTIYRTHLQIIYCTAVALLFANTYAKDRKSQITVAPTGSVGYVVRVLELLEVVSVARSVFKGKEVVVFHKHGPEEGAWVRSSEFGVRDSEMQKFRGRTIREREE